MKKNLIKLCGPLLCLVLISWGNKGHRVIGLIAERHLSADAKAAIHDLLGGQKISDAATWADEISRDPHYLTTASWHFLNLPVGLSYPQFVNAVDGQGEETLYKALAKEEKILANKHAPKTQRVEALKFVIHLVGDLHQPMHVIRAGVQGGNMSQPAGAAPPPQAISRSEATHGNTIPMSFNGATTDLYSLWDTKLIEHEGLSDVALAKKIDRADQRTMAKWQADPVLSWIWESYRLGEQSYQEVKSMKQAKVGEDYYRQHIGQAEMQLEKAGVRLAGLLNVILDKKPG